MLANSMPKASEDHRGTPLAPGRVVTLITKEFWETLDDPHPVQGNKVWGTAYRIAPEFVAEVKEYLDIREINGYSIDHTNFHPADGSADIRCTVYIGTPDNPQFVGPQDPEELAEHIFNSIGPSGRNVEYLLGLEKALNQLSPESGDGHVSDLADRVRELLVKEGGRPDLGFGGEGLQGKGPHDEEEEVEADRA